MAKFSMHAGVILIAALFMSSCNPFSIPQARLGDRVWNDVNGDGIQDEAEPGKEGVEVSLFLEDGELVAADLTDELGFYAFDQLRSGRYYLRFAVPEGWTLTEQDVGDDEFDSDPDPSSGQTAVFNFDSNSTDLSRDAGLLAAVATPESTPTGVPTATLVPATATPVAVFPPGTCHVRADFSGQNACGYASSFSTNLTITVSEDGRSITFEQPDTDDVNVGEIQPDGSFFVTHTKADGSSESYRGVLNEDWSGSALNVYINVGQCESEYEVVFVPLD